LTKKALHQIGYVGIHTYFIGQIAAVDSTAAIRASPNTARHFSTKYKRINQEFNAMTIRVILADDQQQFSGDRKTPVHFPQHG
jgi:hypothetical protein